MTVDAGPGAERPSGFRDGDRGPVVGVTTREVVAQATLLTAIAAVVFWPSIADGGFYTDDWAYAAETRFAGGFTNAVRAFEWLAFRPVQRVYWPATHAVLGPDPALHHLLVVAIGVVASTAFLLVLRMLGTGRLDAAVPAVLLLVFPATEATRLWAGAANANLSIALYLLGTAVALRALRAGGRRSWTLHAAALGLYALGIMTYELVAPAIAASGLLYRLRVSWRMAAPRWAADVVATTVVLVVVTSGTFYEAQGVAGQVRHAVVIARGATAVLGSALMPVVDLRAHPAVAASVAALIVVGLTCAALHRLRRLPPADPFRAELSRWSVVGLAGAVAVAIGYLTFIPADPMFTPLSPGTGTRVNALAALGHVTVVLAAVRVAALLLVGRGPRAGRRSAAAAVAVATALASGYAVRLWQDQQDWVRAAEEQEQILVGLDDLVPDRPRPVLILTTGDRSSVASGVPVFETPWDLTGALQVRRGDRSILAMPLVDGSVLSCTATGVVASSALPERQEAVYGGVVAVDVDRRRVVRVDDRATCDRVRLAVSPPP